VCTCLPRPSWLNRLLRTVVVLTILIAVSALVGMHAMFNMALLLVTPIAAVTIFVLVDEYRFGGPAAPGTGGSWPLIRRVTLLAAGCALPLSLLIAPYLLQGHLSEFVYGTIILPQARSGHAAYEVPSPVVAVGLFPYLILMYRLSRPTKSSLWPLAIALVWFPLGAVVVGHHWLLGYRLIWNAIRFGLLCILPLVFLVLLQPPDYCDAEERTRRVSLLLLAVMASCLSLFQFPFAAPVYFCYVAPLILLTLLAAVRVQAFFPSAFSAPLFLAVGVFALVSANRGYVETIGMRHEVVRLDHPLNIPRASLRVRAEDAAVYPRIVSLLGLHARGTFIHAFPDCPEIYFLANRRNPTPMNFDFFGALSNSDMKQLWENKNVTAIVLNHRPAFSPAPSPQQVALARQVFPISERVARFEVRWRPSQP
jgi:hypothetical protein